MPRPRAAPARSSGAISPEARLLTLCVREPDAADSRQLALAAAAVRDWDVVAALAARHRIAAFVRRAASRGEIALPTQVDDALRQHVLVAVARVLQLDAELGRVMEGLAAVAVPAIVLKGPALARTIYPDPVLRPYGDVDLTVQDRHERTAVATLIERGFDEVPFEAEEARRAHANHVHEGAAFHRMFASAKGVLVELHTDPLQLGLRATCEAARWARARPVPGLPGALMLCPEDQLVQLSAHVHKHGFDRLIWLKDLDLLLRKHGDRLDWGLAASVARREGIRASVWYSLYLAAGLLGAPVPPEVLKRLAPAAPVAALYRLVWPPRRIAALGGHMRRRAVQFHAAESWRGMLPSLVLMGRRRDRVQAVLRATLGR